MLSSVDTTRALASLSLPFSMRMATTSSSVTSSPTLTRTARPSMTPFGCALRRCRTAHTSRSRRRRRPPHSTASTTYGSPITSLICNPARRTRSSSSASPTSTSRRTTSYPRRRSKSPTPRDGSGSRRPCIPAKLSCSMRSQAPALMATSPSCPTTTPRHPRTTTMRRLDCCVPSRLSKAWLVGTLSTSRWRTRRRWETAGASA
mmetsp:Transcript_2934/g.6152  ORF Transcript_2934/g.6152 Transcript_2934/m.6152 type:complete len:204 (+) Transcript_2934:102-713(+)